MVADHLLNGVIGLLGECLILEYCGGGYDVSIIDPIWERNPPPVLFG